MSFNDYSVLDSQYEIISSSTEESVKPILESVNTKKEIITKVMNEIDYETENSMDYYIANKVKDINKINDKNITKEETKKLNKIKSENINQEKSINIINKKIEIKAQKYGDDEVHESWADNAIFYPLTDKIVTPMRELGLTPNGVTYLSTALTFLSLYYLSINKVHYAAIAYFMGYLFDCVDGRMARKYNMGSQFGMVIDMVSDNITNLSLFAYFVYKQGYDHWYIPTLFILTYLLSLSFGINEAIASYKTTGSDNFLERRQKEIGDVENILYKLFLGITSFSYNTYKTFFPKYDEQKINRWLSILRHFGPGNYCLGIIALMLSLEWK